MTNSLSQDIVAVGQLMADNLNTMGVDDADVEDGLTTLAGKILNVVTEKIDTILEIDIDSLNLVYDDDFNITGVLTDENDDAVSYASVKLLIGSTVVDTQTTDGNGEVTFTYCPVSTGTHTFKLVYEGDNTYDNCASSTVTRTVDKETAYIAVGGPSVVGMYSDGEYSVSGSLMDNDSPPEPVKNKQVNVYESNNLITSFTTGSDGAFSGSISGSTLGGVGEHILSFEFAGDDNYTSSTSQKKVVVASTSLSLVSSKDKLSYADGDSCTLTATYTGAILEGRTVVFKAYKNGTLVETIGSDTTDSSGVASVSYSSKGSGDLSIKAGVGSLVSETYIQDCKFYDDQSSDKTSMYTSYGGTITKTYNTGYIQMQATTGTPSLCLSTPMGSATDWSMEIEVKSSSSLFTGCVLLKDSTNYISHGLYNTSYGYASYNYPYDSSKPFLFQDGSTTAQSNTWYKFKFELISNTLYYYVYNASGTLINSKTVSLPSNYQNTNLYFGCWTFNDAITQFRNIKVKPL